MDIRFYATGSGKEPVRHWLQSLADQDRRRVGTAIKKVQHGWPMGLPVCKPLGDGLWEVRVSLAGGTAVRIIFSIADGTMLLLHSFVKKTEKTPKADIDLAKKRDREARER